MTTWLMPAARLLLAACCVCVAARAEAQTGGALVASVSGTVVFNGRAPRTGAFGIFLTPMDRPDTWARAVGHSVGAAFTTSPVPPGRYELDVRPVNELQTWRLEKVTIGGRDVTGRPFDIGTSNIENVVVTLTDSPASLTGSIRGASDREASTVVAVFFPADRSLWNDPWHVSLRFRHARAVRGTYFFNPVLTGEYFVTAVNEDALRDWPTPAFLERLAAQATRVTISTGRAHFLSLEVKHAPQ